VTDCGAPSAALAMCWEAADVALRTTVLILDAQALRLGDVSQMPLTWRQASSIATMPDTRPRDVPANWWLTTNSNLFVGLLMQEGYCLLCCALGGSVPGVWPAGHPL
jgi:hypothetical protein